ncbi:MAG: TonB-dependent receptor, partial [Bacteroidetes bacterium]
FVLSRNMLNNEFYKYPDNDESKNKVFDYNSQEQENKFRYDLNLRKNSRKYLVSANMEYANYYNYTNQQVTEGNQIFNIQYETDLNLIKYGLGLQAVDRFVDGKLLVSAGVRFDGTNYNKQTANLINQTSPRVSASYALSDKWQIKAGTGRFFQLPAYTTLGFKINNAYANKQSAKYIGLNQFNIGFETRIKESILFSFEAFYKDYFNYPIDTITGISIANQGAAYSSVSGTVPAVFSGKGKAYGFEILNRWNKDNLTVLATYTYVRSLFTDLQGEYHPSSWDARHLLTITGTRQFNKNWRFGLKFRFVGGLPYTPYDLENSSLVNVWNINGGPVPDYSKINSERLPGFHQLDIRIDKNFYFKKWTLMLYLDIQNLYNLQYKNQDFVVRKKDENGNYITEQNGNKYVLEKLPNTTGTVLPTVGIRIRF